MQIYKQDNHTITFSSARFKPYNICIQDRPDTKLCSISKKCLKYSMLYLVINAYVLKNEFNVSSLLIHV